MTQNREPIEYSYALIEKTPGNDTNLRVLEIFSADSMSARAMLMETGGVLPDNLTYGGGMVAKMIKLYKGQFYGQYQVEPNNRRAYFLPREHGGDDGYFGSTLNVTVPSGVSSKYSSPTR